jgi:GWxTD domain-containing protein
MFSKKIRNIIYCVIIISLIIPLRAQIFGFKEEKDRSEFFYNITPYPVLDRDSVRMEVTMKVPYSSVQFLKNNDKFQAHFETSIYVHNSEEDKIASYIKDHKIKTEIFQETNSSYHSKKIKHNFYVIPDKYKITMVLNDFETQNPHIREKEIDIADFYDSPITISSINIIEKSADTLSDSTNLAMSNTLVDTTNKFLISFHILTDGGKGEIHYRIYDREEKFVKGKKFLDEFKDGINKIFIPVSKESLLYSRYKLKITVKLKGDKVEKETWFRLRWVGMSNYIADFKAAIEQLAYIASSKEINRISRGEREERKRKFLNFWKSKDPTPGTEKNELMIEYYRRVYFANRNFSEGMEGWKTDRGRIYIVYGPPDHVDRHPFEINTKPYIVWHYYTINKTFYFVDETGFGDYRLINPYEAYTY